MILEVFIYIFLLYYTLLFIYFNIYFNYILYFQFVAHSNVQQLLASIWYEGLPGFRRKNMALQALDIIRIGKTTTVPLNRFSGALMHSSSE